MNCNWNLANIIFQDGMQVLCTEMYIKIDLVGSCCFLRVRKVSKMTEKISKRMVDGVQFASGSVMAPMVKSQAGKSFLAMVPGEVLLASLDAVSECHLLST